MSTQNVPRTNPSLEADDGPFPFVSAVVAAWLMCGLLVFPGDVHAQSNTLLTAAGIAAVSVMSLYTKRIRYANTVLGAYLIASSLVLPLPPHGRINAVICGAIVVACSLLRGKLAPRSTRTISAPRDGGV